MTQLLRSAAVLALAVATATPLAARADAPPATTAVASTALPTTAIASASAGVPAHPRPPADVRPIRTIRSLLGVHRWYQQYADGYPVVGGYYAVHQADDGAVRVDDARVPAGRLGLQIPGVSARLSPTAAVREVTERPAAPAHRASDTRGLWLPRPRPTDPRGWCGGCAPRPDRASPSTTSTPPAAACWPATGCPPTSAPRRAPAGSSTPTPSSPCRTSRSPTTRTPRTSSCGADTAPSRSTTCSPTRCGGAGCGSPTATPRCARTACSSTAGRRTGSRWSTPTTPWTLPRPTCAGSASTT
ncbi:MAG: hypothetical protein R2734_05750 [Nocardioides sp.]